MLAFAGMFVQAGAADRPGIGTTSAAGEIAPRQLIPAGDSRFRYEGRVDFSDPAGPMVIWQGSRIRLDFEGNQLALRFAAATGQNFFNAEVDGVNVIVAVRETPVQSVEVPLPSGPGRHQLVLFKRSEATKGQVRFQGVELAAGAQAWTPAAPAYRLKMEFFGDSITVGACNEDGAIDQWKDFRTHNHALSYATLTSAAFAADHRCVAVSGMGIASGWTDIRAGRTWDRLYPREDSPPAELQTWQPDVAFVLLGENDDSFPRAHGQPFPSAFRAGYVSLVRAMRATYPHTRIVLLRGGMFGGAQSVELREAWTAAVKELETGDTAVSHFVFTHWSTTHPRVSDDRAMADELIVWLKAQPFMQRFL